MPTSFPTHADGEVLSASEVNNIQTAVNQVENSTAYYAADAQASDTYVISLTPAAATPAAGHTYRFRPNTSNTGPATLNVGAGGNIAIVRPNGDPLQTGDLIAGRVYQVTYVGSSWQLTGAFGPYWQLDVDGWYQNNVAASQTAVVLTRGPGPSAGNVWVAPRAGNLVQVRVWSNEARTAGTLTVEVYLNGVATGLTAVLNATDTTFKATAQDPADPFVAGDRLDIRITTDGTWAPTTADIVAGLMVELVDG